MFYERWRFVCWCVCFPDGTSFWKCSRLQKGNFFGHRKWAKMASLGKKKKNSGSAAKGKGVMRKNKGE